MRRRYRNNRRRKRRNRIIAVVSVLVILVAVLVTVGIKTQWKISLKSDSNKTAAEVVNPKVTEKPKETTDGNATTNPTTDPTATPTAEPTEKPEEENASVGVSAVGKPYTVDVATVSKKLNNYDYSNGGKKEIFLTFDDGASNTVTPKVLKTLDKYNVKATFFVTGSMIKNGGTKAQSLIKQEYEKGHAIANHSYSHDYDVLYPGNSLNLKSFLKDYAKTDKLLKEIIGKDFKTRVIRCPGGYMSWNNMDELSKYMKKNDMYSIDWNALSKDAEGKKKNAEQLFECAKETAKGKNMVVLLMHDTYGKEQTAKSLPLIIEYFQKEGYEFKTLS